MSDQADNEGHPSVEAELDADDVAFRDALARKRIDTWWETSGYNYLGPGTDLDWNLAHDVKPVNSLDAAAMAHDIAYAHIKDQWERGLLTQREADVLVNIADSELESAAFKDPPSWAGPGTSVIMDLKRWSDQFFGSSFAGIDSNTRGSRVGDKEKEFLTYTERVNRYQAVQKKKQDADRTRDQYMKDQTINPSKYYPAGAGKEWYWDNSLGQWNTRPMQLIGPGNGSSVSDGPTLDEIAEIYAAIQRAIEAVRRAEEAERRRREQETGAPQSEIAVLDANNDGIPDVLQLRKKRKHGQKKRHISSSRSSRALQRARYEALRPF